METRIDTIRETLSLLNHRRGKGQIKTVRLFGDGRGEAERKGQCFLDTIKFRVETRKDGYRVFALGSSKVTRF